MSKLMRKIILVCIPAYPHAKKVFMKLINWRLNGGLIIKCFQVRIELPNRNMIGGTKKYVFLFIFVYTRSI